MKIFRKILFGACVLGMVGTLGFANEAYAANLTVKADEDDYVWEITGSESEMETISVNHVKVTLGGTTIYDEEEYASDGMVYSDDVLDIVAEGNLGQQIGKKLKVVASTENGNSYSGETTFKNIYKVSVAGDSNGEYEISGEDVPYVYGFAGDEVDLTAYPDDDYEFDGWYVDGKKVSDEEDYTFEMSKSATYTGKSKKMVPSIENVTLTIDNANPKVGDTVKLSWKVSPSDATIDTSTLTLSYSSAYLTVGSRDLTSGYINLKAVKEGSTALTISGKDTNGNSFASNKVDVIITAAPEPAFKAATLKVEGDDFVTVGYPITLKASVNSDATYKTVEWQTAGDATVSKSSGNETVFKANEKGTFKVTVVVKKGKNGTDDTVVEKEIVVYEKPTISYSDRKLTVTVPKKVNTGDTSGGSDNGNYTKCSDITGGKLEILNGDTSLGTTSTAKSSGTSFTIDQSTVETLIKNLKNKFTDSCTLTFRIYPCDSDADINKNVYADCTAKVYKITVQGTGITTSYFYGLQGQSVEITATPEKGTFAGTWEDDKTITTATRTVVVSEDKVYTAVLGEAATSSAEYGEYDAVPKTGEGNTVLYLVLALIATASVAGYAFFKTMKKNNI